MFESIVNDPPVDEKKPAKEDKAAQDDKAKQEKPQAAAYECKPRPNTK